MIKMNVNGLVKEFKATKSEEVLEEIYRNVQSVAYGVVRDIARSNARAFSVDYSEIASIVGFESLLKAIESYEGEKGNFVNWYYSTAKLDALNLIRKQGAEKNSPTNGYISLYIELSEGDYESGFLGDVLEDKSSDIHTEIESEFRRNLLTLVLEEFKKKYPREYAVVMSKAHYANDRDGRKLALMGIYADISDSWGTVRTRASRALDLFSKFLNDKGYSI